MLEGKFLAVLGTVRYAEKERAGNRWCWKHFKMSTNFRSGPVWCVLVSRRRVKGPRVSNCCVNIGFFYQQLETVKQVPVFTHCAQTRTPLSKLWFCNMCFFFPKLYLLFKLICKLKKTDEKSISCNFRY